MQLCHHHCRRFPVSVISMSVRMFVVVVKLLHSDPKTLKIHDVKLTQPASPRKDINTHRCSASIIN